MAAAKVEIIYEAEASSLKAVVNEVNKTNNEIVSSAKQTATKFGDEFKNAAKSAAQAFGNGQIGGAVKSLTTQFNTLTTGLKLNTDAFKKFDVEVKKTNQIIVNSSQDVAKYEDRLRELSVAGQRATQEFQDIAKAVGQYKSAIIAADRAVDLYAKSTDAATGRIGELEDKLYDLALAGQTNTKEFKDLVREVANVKRAIVETDKQVDSFVNRSRGFGTVVQNIELVGSAFQVVEGAAALFGDENKQLQETLVRLQAITAITSGIEQARLVLIDQTAQKTGIAAIAQKGYNLAVGTSTGVLKGFRLALAATGIGLLVIGVVALIQNFDKVKRVLSNAIPGFGEVAKGIGKVIDKTKEFLGIDDGGAKAKLALDNLIGSEKRKTDFQVKELDRRIALLKSENKDTSALEKEKEDIIIESLTKQRKAVRDNGAELLKLDDETKKQIRENTIAVEAEILDRQNDLQVKSIEISKKAAQERLKINEERIRKSLLIDGESEQERIKLATNAANQEKLNAEQSIVNVKLRAATIARIEQELANNIEAIRLDERRKANETRILQLDAIQAAGKLEVDQAIELAKAKAEAQKIAAGSETDPAKRAALEAKAVADGEKEIKEIKAAAFQADVELFTARLQLQQELGDFSVATQKKLVEVEFKGREAALIAAADQTVEGQAKLTQDLLKLKADERKALNDIDKNAVDKAIELEILRIQTLEELGKASFNDKKNLINEELQLKINAIDRELISEQEKEKKRALARAEANGEIKALDQQLTQEILDIANATADAFGAILEVQKLVSENRVADIEKVRDTEIAAIEKSTDSERKKQDKIAAANLRAQQKIKAEKTKQAQADKAIAVFEAIIGTAAAVASAKTIPLKVLAGIIGATQLAIILAQPIPKFKKGGIVGGRSHEAGGTMIEAEKGEFIVNRSSVARHRDALDAMNRSSAAFKKYVDERYVRPALMDYASKNRGASVTVNASLNSKSMEREIKGLRKDIKGKSTVININSSDSRYQWQ
jgi:hypothetical protein